MRKRIQKALNERVYPSQPRRKKDLLDTLVKSYKLNFKRIEQKRRAAKQIRLYLKFTLFKKKLMAFMVKYITDIKNCQRFFKWTNKYLEH